MQKIKTYDWATCPASIFTVVWALQIFGHLIFLDTFDPIESNTWIILGAATAAFFLGCLIPYISHSQHKQPYLAEREHIPQFVRIFARLILPLYIITVAAPQVAYIFFLESLSLGALRNDLIASAADNDRGVIFKLYVHYAFALASLLSIAYASLLSRRILIIIVGSGFLAGLLTYGRNILLLYVLSTGVLLYSQRIVSVRMLIAMFLSFVCVFFSLAFYMEKGGVDGGVLENIVWNFKVYLFAGFAAFNSYIKYNDPNISGLLLVPNVLKDLFSYFGAELEPTPTVFPFVETPLPTNVYTALFPWHHDAGMFGLFLGFLFIGFFSTWLYLKRHRSRLNLFLYSLCLYPLVMMIFEEQYARAYTLWVLVAILLLVFFILEFPLIRVSSKVYKNEFFEK
jgi:oligosaccharide repeat unit polymerase